MIDELVNSTSYPDLLNGLSKAISEKSIHQWNAPQDFERLFECLVNLGGDSAPALTVAALGRVESVLRKVVFDPGRVLELLVEQPDILALGEGDDRYYAALQIGRVQPDWLYSWSLEQIWAEPGSDKARKAHATNLMKQTESLDSLFSELGKVGNSYVKRHELDEGKAATRLSKVIKSLRSALRDTDVACSVVVGVDYDKFVGAAFGHFPPSECEKDARKSAVSEVLGMVVDLIGTKFSLAIENNTYRVVSRLNSWCSYDYWLSITKSDASMEKLRATLTEAILILVRQNIADGELLKLMRLCCQTESDFLSICAEAVDSSHLEPQMANWLGTGGKARESLKVINSEAEISERHMVNDVGILLVRFQESEPSLALVKDSMDDLELFDPGLVPVFEGLSNHWEILKQVVEKLAERNNVSLLGGIGEVVDVDRSIFELVDEGDVSPRRAQVVRPAVIQEHEDKTRVIQKGILRPARD